MIFSGEYVFGISGGIFRCSISGVCFLLARSARDWLRFIEGHLTD